jgi:hypothetical protein
MSSICFVDVLKKNLFNDKYSVHLSPKDIKFIDTLLNGNPEMFNQIHGMVDEIISDGVLDIHDIPKIVLLIGKIYKNNLIGEILKHVKILSVVRFTVDSLLESGLIPLPEVEIHIIKKIVDVSIDLLSTNIDIIEEKTRSCRAWFKRVFCKCCKSSSPSKSTEQVVIADKPKVDEPAVVDNSTIDELVVITDKPKVDKLVIPDKPKVDESSVPESVNNTVKIKPTCGCDCTKCENVVDPKCNSDCTKCDCDCTKSKNVVENKCNCEATKTNTKCNCPANCNCQK